MLAIWLWIFTKAQVGLGNVDNTSDSVKNVLSADKWTTSSIVWYESRLQRFASGCIGRSSCVYPRGQSTGWARGVIS